MARWPDRCRVLLFSACQLLRWRCEHVYVYVYEKYLLLRKMILMMMMMMFCVVLLFCVLCCVLDMFSHENIAHIPLPLAGWLDRCRSLPDFCRPFCVHLVTSFSYIFGWIRHPSHLCLCRTSGRRTRAWPGWRWYVLVDIFIVHRHQYMVHVHAARWRTGMEGGDEAGSSMIAGDIRYIRKTEDLFASICALALSSCCASWWLLVHGCSVHCWWTRYSDEALMIWWPDGGPLTRTVLLYLCNPCQW